MPQVPSVATASPPLHQTHLASHHFLARHHHLALLAPHAAAALPPSRAAAWPLQAAAAASRLLGAALQLGRGGGLLRPLLLLGRLLLGLLRRLPAACGRLLFDVRLACRGRLCCCLHSGLISCCRRWVFHCCRGLARDVVRLCALAHCVLLCYVPSSAARVVVPAPHTAEEEEVTVSGGGQAAVRADSGGAGTLACKLHTAAMLPAASRQEEAAVLLFMNFRGAQHQRTPPGSAPRPSAWPHRKQDTHKHMHAAGRVARGYMQRDRRERTRRPPASKKPCPLPGALAGLPVVCIYPRGACLTSPQPPVPSLRPTKAGRDGRVAERPP